MERDRQAEILAAALGVVEALEFYADPHSYFALTVIPDPPCGHFAYDTAPLSHEESFHYVDYRDGGTYHGKRAREALAAWRKVAEG